MHEEYKYDDREPCPKCWKSHLHRMVVTIAFYKPGESQPQSPPLETEYFFCQNCQKVIEEL
jgi:hypothetical protein